MKLEFIIPQENVLNVNQRKHWRTHQEPKKYLKNLGIKTAIENHSHKELAQKKADSLLQWEHYSYLKAKHTKDKKAGKATIQPTPPEETPQCPPQYTKCAVIVTITPPTKRRFDPPNIYPTVKPIIDGLTIGSFWEDDNTEHITSMTFTHDTSNPIKGCYVITLEILPQ